MAYLLGKLVYAIFVVYTEHYTTKYQILFPQYFHSIPHYFD